MKKFRIFEVPKDKVVQLHGKELKDVYYVVQKRIWWKFLWIIPVYYHWENVHLSSPITFEDRIEFPYYLDNKDLTNTRNALIAAKKSANDFGGPTDLLTQYGQFRVYADSNIDEILEQYRSARGYHNQARIGCWTEE